MPARIGAFGLLLTIQALFLWAHRRDVSPYHEAQRHFVAGDYGAAREILEGISDDGRESVDALVLLGNTYRQLGQLERSRRALARALELKPAHHLALFSAGKLRLVCGDYDAARDFILQALEAGAPPIVKFELAQCHYLLGESAEATSMLSDLRVTLADQPAQQLMAAYVLHALGAGAPPSAECIRDNLAYWREEAHKYDGSAYATALYADIQGLQALSRDA